MLRHLAGAARSLGAAYLGVHWVKAERNEHAAAFLFSLPGATFVPVRDGAALGLGPMLRRHHHQYQQQQQQQQQQGVPSPAPLPPSPPLPTPTAHALSSVGSRTSLVVEPLVPSRTSPVVEPLVPSSPADDAVSSDGIASHAQAAVLDALRSGQRPALAAFPPTSALDRLPRAERKALARRLISLVSRTRHGELSKASTRAEVGLLIRGRIGGELCRHTQADQPCTRAGCPFTHTKGTLGRAAASKSAIRASLRIVDGVSSEGRGVPTGLLSVALTLTVGACASDAHDGSCSAASRAEEARLRDVIGLSMRRAHIPNKISNKMLLNMLAPPASKSRDLDTGESQRWRADGDWPGHGIILIPIESAAAAEVSFKPSSVQQPQQHQQGREDQQAADSNAAPPLGATHSEQTACVAFESSSGCALHYETVQGLAEALSSDPRRLHDWVSAESDRSHPLPDAFCEIWARGKQHAEQPEQQPPQYVHIEDGNNEASEAAQAHHGELDAVALQARLRQRMRSAMQVTLQQAKPESYYKDVDVDPL